MFKAPGLTSIYLSAVVCLCPSAYAQFDSDENAIENELRNQERHEESIQPQPQSQPEERAQSEAEPPREPKIEVPVVRPGGFEPEYDGSARATSSGQGTPLFDWSKHRGEKEVQHPFAEKGLIRISKDRTYFYKVEESPQTRAMTFRAGIFNPSALSNPDEKGQPGSTFHDNYAASTSPALMLDYEWQRWRTDLGKIGLRAGSGLFLAQGNGHFVGGVNAGLTPKEVFTFVTIPINLGLIYRMNFGRRQLFVPYVEGGGTIFSFTEMRDDSKPPKFGAAPGAYAAAGMAFNMTYFDALSRIQLDREYWISAIYLKAEYRQLIAFSRYDFTSPLVNGGFCMEF